MKNINDDFWKIISSNNRYDCKYNTCWQKRGYSLVAGRKTNGFVDCASFNKRYLLVRFINLFRLCTKNISRFYVSFRLEPISEPMIEPMIEPISEPMIEPIWVLKYTIVTIEEGIYEFRKRK